MAVLHTTLFELYSRLWTVHEIDAAMLQGVSAYGLYDRRYFSQEEIKHFQSYRRLYGEKWDEVLAKVLRSKTFACAFRFVDGVSNRNLGIQVVDSRRRQLMQVLQAIPIGGVTLARKLDMVRHLLSRYRVSTSEAQCRIEDRSLLVGKIRGHGGFRRLDKKITLARVAMAKRMVEHAPQFSAEWSFGKLAAGLDAIAGLSLRDLVEPGPWPDGDAVVRSQEWSGALSIDAAIRQLAQLEPADQKRPILLRVPAGVLSQRHRFKDAQAAIAHLVREKEGENDYAPGLLENAGVARRHGEVVGSCLTCKTSLLRVSVPEATKRPRSG